MRCATPSARSCERCRAGSRDGPGWPEFLRSQAQGIRALDFFTAVLLNGARVYVLAAIEHGTRRVRILGATEHPARAWVVQQARNLLMDLEDAGTRAKFVLLDRDQLHRRVRRAIPGRWRHGHPLRGPGVADEFGHRALDRQLPARAPGPDPGLEPAAPDDRAARVRGLLQHPPPAPHPETSRAVPPAARRCHRPGPSPGPAA